MCIRDSQPTLAQVTAIVQQAVASNPLGLLAIASTAQTPLAFVPGNVTVPGASQTTLVTSLVVALYYQLIGTEDVVSRTHGHPPYALSLIHISEPTRLLSISYAVFCLKKKKKK